MSQVDDDLSLRNLMATYLDAVYRRDGSTWQSTWAEDCSWELAGHVATGRDDIYTLWQQAMGSFEFALLLPSFGQLDIHGDRATGFWYLQEFTRGHDGTGSSIISCYRDNCVREQGRWLYQKRSYSVIYHGSADLSGAYTPPAV